MQLLSQVEIVVKLIAPPQYVVVTSCLDRDMGMQKIQEVSLVCAVGIQKACVCSLS